MLENLTPNIPQGRPIDVTFSYDENGMMKCKYKDVESNKEMPVDLSIDKDKASDAERKIAKQFKKLSVT